MKKRLPLSLLSSLFLIGLASSNAQAQSAFAGFYGQISTGYENNQLGSTTTSATELPNNNSDINLNGASQSFGSAPLVLGIGYHYQASDNWLIGVGADYSALSQTSSTFPLNATNASGNTTIAAGSTLTANGASMKLSNRFNLFVTPAYAIDKDKLVYLKAGYSQVGTQYNRQTSSTKTVNGVSTSVATTGGSQSTNQGGYLVGLGYKQMITGGLYGFVEGNYLGYSTPTDSYNNVNKAINKLNGVSSTGTRTVTTNFASLNTCQLLIGVGYAF